MRRLDTFPATELIQQYRATFSTRAGHETMKHMLYDLGAFEETLDFNEDVVLKNYATHLLKIMAGGEIGAESIEQFINRLITQPFKRQDEA